MRRDPSSKTPCTPVVSVAFFHPHRRESEQDQNSSPESPETPELSAENTLFYQLIRAERHNYHQRAYRRLARLGDWFTISILLSMFAAIFILMLVVLDHSTPTDYNDWHEYLKLKSCIDVTPAAEVTTTISTHIISTTDDYTGVLVQVTIPYNQVEAARSWSNSWERKLVVKYERPDGAWAILKLDPDDMKAYIDESFYHYDPHPYVYTATVSYADGFWNQLHSLILRKYQEYTLFVHVQTRFGAFCALIGLFGFWFFVLWCVDKVRMWYLHEHLRYCGKYEEDVEQRNKRRQAKNREDDDNEEMET